jgi:hypothetical protein
MTPQIRLQRHQVADFQLIRDLGVEAIQRVIPEVKNLGLVPKQPADIQAVLMRASGGNKNGIEALLRQLLSLHGLVRELNLSSTEIFAALNAGLHPAESKWLPEEFDRWVSVSPLVKELFELEVVRLSAKALDLSYEHSELLQRARILTDIRPVFNDDASEVRGTVISHTLLLRYDDIEGDHVLSLALDEGDIRSLIQQCERALKKSQTARTHLEAKAGIPAIVPGKDEKG